MRGREISHLETVGCRIEAWAYLVGLVGSGGSDLALLARGELGEITVVVTLPASWRND